MLEANHKPCSSGTRILAYRGSAGISRNKCENCSMFAEGSLCWITDETMCYLPARVTKTFRRGETGHVTKIGAQQNSKIISQLLPSETLKIIKLELNDLDEIADLSQMTLLTYPNILYHLRNRFYKGFDMTNIGGITIWVYSPNYPQSLNNTNSVELMDEDLGTDRSILKHAVANAVNNLTLKNQCCLIFGRQASNANARTVISQVLGSLGDAISSQMTRRISEALSIVMPFGSIRLPDNLSEPRFGLQLDLNVAVTDSRRKQVFKNFAINCHMLEFNRVTNSTAGRNFNIFYQLLAAIGDGRMLRNYRNVSAWKFRFIEGAPDEQDLKGWEILENSLIATGLSKDRLEDLSSILLSILVLGNLASQTNAIKDAITEDTLIFSTLGKLTGLSAETWMNLFNKNETSQITKPKVNERPLIEKANYVARTLYALAVHYIITFLNASSIDNKMKASSLKSYRTFCVLNMCGLANYAGSSLEKLCANLYVDSFYALMKKQFVESERSEYDVQRIRYPVHLFSENYKLIHFMDKDDIINSSEMLNNINPYVPGIFRALSQKYDDILMMPREVGNGIQQEKRFLFKVRHYYEAVTYDASMMFTSENSKLRQELANLLSHSSNTILRENNNLLSTSVGTNFNEVTKKDAAFPNSFSQLSALLSFLEGAELQVLAVVRSSTDNVDTRFHCPLVLEEMENLGFGKIVRARDHHFAVRMTCVDFVKKYRILVRRGIKDYDSRTLAAAEALAEELSYLGKLNQGSWCIGHPDEGSQPKIFLKQEQYEILDAAFYTVINAALGALVFNFRRRHIIKQETAWLQSQKELKLLLRDPDTPSEALQDALKSAESLYPHGDAIQRALEGFPYSKSSCIHQAYKVLSDRQTSQIIASEDLPTETVQNNISNRSLDDENLGEDVLQKLENALKPFDDINNWTRSDFNKISDAQLSDLATAIQSAARSGASSESISRGEEILQLMRNQSILRQESKGKNGSMRPPHVVVDLEEFMEGSFRKKNISSFISTDPGSTNVALGGGADNGEYSFDTMDDLRSSSNGVPPIHRSESYRLTTVEKVPHKSWWYKVLGVLVDMKARK